MINDVFLAVVLPPKQISTFAQLQTELKTLHLPIVFQKSETPHVTLSYFGDVREEKFKKIENKVEESLSMLSSFELKFSEHGVFGSRKFPRVSYIQNQSPDFIDNTRDFREVFLKYQSSKEKKRDYIPHMTISRIKSAKIFLRDIDIYANIVNKYHINFDMSEIALFASDNKTGDKQVEIRRFSLVS